MSSPFPGMDPYLEDPDVWPDFHDHFAGEIAAELNSSLPRPFYAQLGKRTELGIVEEGSLRRIVPDVALLKSRLAPDAATVAVLAQPRRQASPSVEVRIQLDPLEHSFVEIRDANRGHAIVTVIEIASPSNKSPGPDRKAYLAKQREVLDSDASLVEIDLLRAGDRLLSDPGLELIVAQRNPSPDYLVLIHRSWKRSDTERTCDFFPISLPEPLPCIPVPLRETVPVVLLDLQFAMNRAYDRGPYLRGAIDYSQPPRPPLQGERALWVKQCLSDFRARHSEPRPME